MEPPKTFLVEDLETTLTTTILLSSQEDCSNEVEFDIIFNQTPGIQNVNNLQVG